MKKRRVPKNKTVTIAVLLVSVFSIVVWQNRNNIELKYFLSSSVAVIGNNGNISQHIEGNPDGTLKVVFSIEQDGLNFSDAITMSQAEFNNKSAGEIQQIMWKRFENWRTYTNQ